MHRVLLTSSERFVISYYRALSFAFRYVLCCLCRLSSLFCNNPRLSSRCLSALFSSIVNTPHLSSLLFQLPARLFWGSQPPILGMQSCCPSVISILCFPIGVIMILIATVCLSFVGSFETPLDVYWKFVRSGRSLKIMTWFAARRQKLIKVAAGNAMLYRSLFSLFKNFIDVRLS